MTRLRQMMLDELERRNYSQTTRSCESMLTFLAETREYVRGKFQKTTHWASQRPRPVLGA
jgi:hypothetical protein